MPINVESSADIVGIQGDKVLVHIRKDGMEPLTRTLTFVHVVDVDRHELRLVNRESRPRKPDWPVTQKLMDAVQPAERNEDGVKWSLSVKL